MVRPVHIEPSISGTIGIHQEVGRYTLSILWKGRWLIIGAVLVALLVAAGALAVLPSTYTSEAAIQLNFDRHGRSRNGSIATLDPMALVNSEIEVIRSQRTASAVVTRLGLTKNPSFTRLSRLSVALHWLQSAAGNRTALPTPHDRAVAALMQKVKVWNRPNSYVIMIAVTLANPAEAQQLANAMAEEYMRLGTLRHLAWEEANTEAKIAALAGKFGERYPALQSELQLLGRTRRNFDRLRNAHSGVQIVALADGDQSFLPAVKSSIPSGPKSKLIVMVAVFVGCGIGVFLALRRQRNFERLQGSDDERRAAGVRTPHENQDLPEKRLWQLAVMAGAARRAAQGIRAIGSNPSFPKMWWVRRGLAEVRGLLGSRCLGVMVSALPVLPRRGARDATQQSAEAAVLPVGAEPGQSVGGRGLEGDTVERARADQRCQHCSALRSVVRADEEGGACRQLHYLPEHFEGGPDSAIAEAGRRGAAPQPRGLAVTHRRQGSFGQPSPSIGGPWQDDLRHMHPMPKRASRANPTVSGTPEGRQK
jgi:capsular polysaccharide biosynthesis protein